jgi:hypothetical protein
MPAQLLLNLPEADCKRRRGKRVPIRIEDRAPASEALRCLAALFEPRLLRRRRDRGVRARLLARAIRTEGARERARRATARRCHAGRWATCHRCRAQQSQESAVHTPPRSSRAPALQRATSSIAGPPEPPRRFEEEAVPTRLSPPLAAPGRSGNPGGGIPRDLPPRSAAEPPRSKPFDPSESPPRRRELGKLMRHGSIPVLGPGLRVEWASGAGRMCGTRRARYSV